MNRETKSNLLIAVDKNDKVLDYESKLKYHIGKGGLHRAFSIFIFNRENELLIHQRGALKFFWPLFGQTVVAVIQEKANLAKKRKKED